MGFGSCYIAPNGKLYYFNKVNKESYLVEGIIDMKIALPTGGSKLLLVFL